MLSKYCCKCGALSLGGRFCMNCGASLEFSADLSPTPEAMNEQYEHAPTYASLYSNTINSQSARKNRRGTVLQLIAIIAVGLILLAGLIIGSIYIFNLIIDAKETQSDTVANEDKSHDENADSDSVAGESNSTNADASSAQSLSTTDNYYFTLLGKKTKEVSSFLGKPDSKYESDEGVTYKYKWGFVYSMPAGDKAVVRNIFVNKEKSGFDADGIDVGQDLKKAVDHLSGIDGYALQGDVQADGYTVFSNDKDDRQLLLTITSVNGKITEIFANSINDA